MPIYEYRCDACGREFSLLRPMSESSAAGVCPQCGAKDARRLVSGFAAVGGTEDCGPVG